MFVVVGDPQDPPRTPEAIAAYADFVGRMAARYRGRVAGWEIWNEPDAPKFWAGLPELTEDHPERDASQYVPLLRAAYRAAKAADPHTPVVLGPMTGNDHRFVASVYAHGGRRYFDAVATHTDTGCLVASPYDYARESAGGPISQWSFLGYRSVRDVMVRHGDARKPIWLTEFGWSSYTGPCRAGKWAGTKPAGVGEAAQARFTREAVHCLSEDRYVTKALIFTLNEREHADPMNTGYGLVRPDDARKPVWDAFTGFARRGDVLPAREECGDFTAPRVRVRATAGALAVRASDRSGVLRIALFADGRRVRAVTARSTPARLARRLRRPGARRRLTVVVTDRLGNRARRAVRVPSRR